MYINWIENPHCLTSNFKEINYLTGKISEVVVTMFQLEFSFQGH